MFFSDVKNRIAAFFASMGLFYGLFFVGGIACMLVGVGILIATSVFGG